MPNYRPLILDAKSLIKNASDNIDNNIELLCPNNVGLCAQNVLSQVRNLIDGLAILKYYNDNANGNIESGKDLITESIKHLKNAGNRFAPLVKLHTKLQIVASHYTQDLFNSESLLIWYKDYLDDVKEIALTEFNIAILRNLDKFPFECTAGDSEYYTNIYDKLSKKAKQYSGKGFTYYIEKKRRRIKGLYEYVLSPANDKRTKFDHITVYSLENIPTYHPIETQIQLEPIRINDIDITFAYLIDYVVSIRPCEIKRLSLFLKQPIAIKRDSGGYSLLMHYLTKNKISLFDVVMADSFEQEMLKAGVSSDTNIYSILKAVRDFIDSGACGSVTLKYLLYTLRHDIMIRQYSKNEERCFDNTAISKRCYPFEKNPYAFSLIKHNPRIQDLFECFPELYTRSAMLKRALITNIENNKNLYTPISELDSSFLTKELAEDFNDGLDPVSEDSKIIFVDNRYATIKSYEKHTVSIIKKIISMCDIGDDEYGVIADDYIDNNVLDIDDDKKNILRTAFLSSSVLLINGSAGTGKTTIIRHLTNILKYKKILFLSCTHTAVENIKKRVGLEYGRSRKDFMTIESYLEKKRKGYYIDEYEILVVDECSMADNESIDSVLNGHEFKKIIMVGDEKQIESIKFGNWFGIANILANSSSHELSDNHRTTDLNLRNIWQQVRELREQNELCSRIVAANYHHQLDSTLFEPVDEDEVILCLNYDGMYGINNINKYLQEKNENRAVSWKVWRFKKGDKILFNDNYNFRSVFYNNQKGRIVELTEEEDRVIFVVRVLSEEGNAHAGNSFVDYIKTEGGYDYYSIVIYKDDDDDEDDESKRAIIVPFQLGYAISIHKSQGLEFNSVKVVLTKEIAESISHNIFYTAITRAKKHLRLYCDVESLDKICKNFKILSYDGDSIKVQRRLDIY